MDTRATKIKELEANIERLKAADKADLAKTQTKLGELKVAQAARRDPVYSNFSVRWKKDGKYERIAQVGQLSLEELKASIRGVERACMEKLKTDEPPGKGESPQLIKAAFRRRAEARKGEISVLQERIARLRDGSTAASEDRVGAF